MRRQNIVFIALPTGRDGSVFRMSAFISPRLSTNEGSTLSLFPDWTNWATKVRSMTWSVKVGASTLVPTVVSPLPDPNAWAMLFAPNMLLNSFVFKGLHNRDIRSYPAQNLDDFLQNRYGRIAVENPEGAPPVADLLANDMFGKIAWAPPRQGRAGGRQAALNRLNTKFENGTVPPAPLDPAVDFVQAELFLRPPQGGGARPADVEEQDFHQALSLLARHPALLRTLGLVVDFTFTLTGALPATVAVELQPTWTPSLSGPGTRTVQIRPRTMTTSTTFLPKSQNADDEVQDGFLVLGDGSTRLMGVDLLQATNRLLRFGSMLRRLQEPEHDRHPQPEEQHAPSLTQVGLLLVRSGRAGRVRERFERQRDLDTSLVNAAAATPTGTFDLFAGDLVRGYRYDVLDHVATQWRSLYARKVVGGAYRIVGKGTTGDLLISTGEDEGWGGTTPATDGTANGDLYLAETLARWNGWSLAAPRPGNIVDGETGESIPPPPNEPTDESVVPLAVSYEATPGSLPRLRFGRKYQMRARAVDLGGNSLDLTDVAPTDVVSPDVVYGRFEPVSSPTLMRRVARNTPRDRTDRLVIRSNYDVPDNAASVPPAERHVVPPSAAQLLVEQHGEPQGGVTPGTYNMLKTRDGKALEDIGTLDPATGEYFFTGGVVPVPYLPDPMARGAVFQGLPGAAGPLKVPFRPQGSNYPTTTPFRLVLKAGSGAPVPPTSASKALNVFLPKAGVVKVKLSSHFASGDVTQFGLWHWLSPADQTSLAPRIRNGRHVLFTPSRELTLIHAVRQPLVVPSLPTLTATRPRQGALHANIEGTLELDRASTERVTLTAQWTDLVDDVTQPEPADVSRTARLEAVQIPVEGADDEEPIPRRRLEIGDTKHHEVDVTAEAVSRFTRFFEEEVELTLNGTTPAEVSAAGVIPETVTVTSQDGSVGYRLARDGVGDFVVEPGPPGTVARTAGSDIPSGATVRVVFVAPPVTRLSTEGGLPPTTVTVLSSKRPTAPEVRYILPVFGRVVSGDTIERRARAVRVYLARPWNVSGNGELLGVLLTSYQDDPFDGAEDYATRFGRDPLWDTGAVDSFPDASDFLLGSVTAEGLTLPEVPGQEFIVVGYEVSFDADRGLWYSDIRALSNPSYTPFMRLGLVRYQPNSMDGKHLSPPVACDPVQLLPNRLLTVAAVADPLKRQVTVSGISYLEFAAGPLRNPTMFAAVQEADADISDPDLKWANVAGTLNNGKGVKLTRTAPASASTDTSWTGEVTLPATGGPFRILVREFERHQEDAEGGGFTAKDRPVYIETFDL